MNNMLLNDTSNKFNASNDTLERYHTQRNGWHLGFRRDGLSEDDTVMSNQTLLNHALQVDTDVSNNALQVDTDASNNAFEKEKELVANIVQKMVTVHPDMVNDALFTLSNKLQTMYAKTMQHITLLYFDDDTMRPVLSIDDKYVTIVKELYQKMDVEIEIEKTNTTISDMITKKELEPILGKDLSVQMKQEYLKSYIPMSLDQIVANKIIQPLSNKLFPTSRKATPSTASVKPHAVKNRHIKVEYLDYTPAGVPIPIKQEYPPTPDIDQYLTSLGIVVPPLTTPSVESKRGSAYTSSYTTPSTGYMKYTGNKQSITYTGWCGMFPAFAENCEIWDPENPVNFIQGSSALERAPEPEPEKKESTMYIILNDKYLKTTTMQNPSEDVLHVLHKEYEYGCIPLFQITTQNENILKFMETEFDHASFASVNILNEKIEILSKYIQLENKSPLENENERHYIKTYVMDKCIFTADANDKIKASTLHEKILKSNIIHKIDDVGFFNKRLMKHLASLGLNKKRYDDGYYYYGLTMKEDHTPNANYRYNGRIDEIINEYRDTNTYMSY